MTDMEIKLQEKIENLQADIKEKDRKIERMEEQMKNKIQESAGRKPANEEWAKLFAALMECYESQKLINDTIENLQTVIKEKDREIEQLKEQIKKKNQRNAGRRRANEEWTKSFAAFMECYESQKSISDTVKELNISRSTYYRYKRLYDATSVSIEK